jgi:hypothetical protein
LDAFTAERLEQAFVKHRPLHHDERRAQRSRERGDIKLTDSSSIDAPDLDQGGNVAAIPNPTPDTELVERGHSARGQSEGKAGLLERLGPLENTDIPARPPEGECRGQSPDASADDDCRSADEHRNSCCGVRLHASK